MVSKTRVTHNKRNQRVKKMGQKRKARNRNKGTTPPFPIHLEKSSPATTSSSSS